MSRKRVAGRAVSMYVLDVGRRVGRDRPYSRNGREIYGRLVGKEFTNYALPVAN